MVNGKMYGVTQNYNLEVINPNLANQIFSAFSQEATGLKFHTLDCGCIYYQRVHRDGGLDPQIGIYRDAKDGPCEICIVQEDRWGKRVIDENVVYNSKFQIETV